MMRDGDEAPQEGNRALGNADRLLSLLARRGPQQLAQIATETDIPRSSVYRLVESLELIGFVTVQSDGAVALGTRLLGIADHAQEAIPEVRAARLSLRALTGSTGHTSYFCARRDRGIVCLDWCPGRSIGLPVLRRGMSLPAHAGAASLAILAAEGTPVAEVFRGEALEKVAPKTITDVSVLQAAVEEVRASGISVSDEDVTPGVAAIGIAVFDEGGELRGALSVAGLRGAIILDAAALAERLREQALLVSSRLTPR